MLVSQDLLEWIDQGGLDIVETRTAAAPKNATKGMSKKKDRAEADFFPKVFQARQNETVSLFRLRIKSFLNNEPEAIESESSPAGVSSLVNEQQ